MNGFLSRALAAASAALCLMSVHAGAQAQAAWPARPIRLVVGFAPGGTTDVMARTMSQVLTEALGQSVIVDNKPGASGNLAAQDVVKATPDGYTLLVAPTSVETANPSLFKASFNPAKDLTPVGAVGRSAMYVVARNSLEVKDAKGLVAYGKANPGKLSYASAGTGTPPHLAAELFKQQTGIFATHIPYRGAAPALQDVMAGQVDYVFDPGIAFPHIRTGKVKLLGVASAKRSPFFPDAPTLAEQGIEGAEMDIWFGVWAPNGISPDIIARLNRELARTLAQPAIRQRFADLGAEPAPMDSVAFRKLLDDEGKVLTALIRDRKVAVD
ncbi:tripartite tricarboxylate transporter substrate binding protein [Variovorax sp. OV329]|uniref:Bug family tripartite tricarboxylate transporter substrate binding protein n=1 Tax=Variovorax sp. OV329 TaxID=1882825 RepID=UPI0008E87C28|nr:tripartite tricarboxylate transporter substrate binding protein [Variovorax sp. OV329]SFN40921.1 Tripartite-type tricarboxylate transporter, receptor component TctC [Variovorax sp. OV329]